MDEKMIQKVQDLGKRISQSKSDKAKYEGAMGQVLASLKQSNAINSIDEALALISEQALKIEAKEAEASAIYNLLITKFTW